MTTPIRGLDEIASGQAQPEISHNAAIRHIEQMLGDDFQIIISDEDTTPDPDDVVKFLVLRCTGTLTATRQLILPSKKAVWIVRNECTGGSIYAKTAGGTGVKVGVGSEVLVRGDGTNIKAGSAGEQVQFMFGAGLGSTSGTRFLFPGYDTSSASVLEIPWRVPFDCWLYDLLIEIDGGVNAGGDPVVFTVRVEKANTALVASVAPGATQGQNFNRANAPFANKGDRVSISVAVGSTPTAPARIVGNFIGSSYLPD